MKILDVRRAPIHILGHRIDQNGELHIPKEKLLAVLDELKRAVEILNTAPDMVEGVSKFAGGAPTNILDENDLRQVVEAHYRHFLMINPLEAERFLREAELILGFALVDHAARPTRIWRCALTAPGRSRRGGGCRPSGENPWNSHRQDGRPSGAVDVDGEDVVEEPREMVLVGDGLEEPLSGIDDDYEVDGISALFGNGDTGADSRAGTALDDADDEEDLPILPILHHAIEDNRSFRLIDPANTISQEHFSKEMILEEINGVETERGEGEPPASPFLDNEVFFICRWSPRLRATVIAWMPSIPGSSPVVRKAPNVRREVALVRWLRLVVEKGTRDPRGLEFVTDDPWLPKHLLQAGRRFHRPILFREVLDLHRDAQGTHSAVFVMGGREMPEVLDEAVERAEQVPFLGG